MRIRTCGLKESFIETEKKSIYKPITTLPKQPIYQPNKEPRNQNINKRSNRFKEMLILDYVFRTLA